MSLLTAFGEMRVVGDPTLRFTPDGVAVANVRLVCNARKRNDQGGWEDDPKKVLWANASIWRKPAENLVNSVRDKDLVNVVGTIYTREYEHNGEKRTSVEIEAVSISPALTFRATPHSDQQQGAQPAQGAPQGQQQPAYAPQNGQWNSQPQQAQQPAYAQQGVGQQGGWAEPYQQPPF